MLAQTISSLQAPLAACGLLKFLCELAKLCVFKVLPASSCRLLIWDRQWFSYCVIEFITVQIKKKANQRCILCKEYGVRWDMSFLMETWKSIITSKNISWDMSFSNIAPMPVYHVASVTSQLQALTNSGVLVILILHCSNQFNSLVLFLSLRTNFFQ